MIKNLYIADVETFAIFIPLVIIFQMMQWVWALCDLHMGTFETKKAFFISLIPGLFIFYALRWIGRMFEKFMLLR